MKQIILFLLLFTAAAPVTLAALADSAATSTPSLTCDTGPITETYGATEWLVYSCSDSRTLVLLSAPRNPATPFYFTLYPGESGYLVAGEGNGNEGVTDAALAEIKALTSAEIENLIESTKSQ
jgi:hypothetical protein